MFFKLIKCSSNFLHNFTACSQMGTCLFSGDGLRRDVTKSAAWFRKAAEQGATQQNAAGDGWEVRGLCDLVTSIS